ncbi:MAG TPA: hypothetical protein VKE69_10250, partial [Planctomycetota bacterium]|nr:hypothetical protein [Planctomycetota bacterium]
MRRATLVRAAAAAAFTFVLAEAAARFAMPRVLGAPTVPADAPRDAYFAALGPHPTDAPTAREPAPKSGPFRIVAVGDSTAVGFPYGEPLSFTSLLASGLTAATSRPCEARHVGVPGRSSAGVVAELDAAFAERPDVLVVYVGHNEFAQRLAVRSPFGPIRHGGFENVVPGLHDLAASVRGWLAERRVSRLEGIPEAHLYELKGALRLVAFGDPERCTPANLPLTDREVELHLERYRANLRAIGIAAAAHGVPIVFAEPSSSLLAPPLASGARFDPRAQRAWELGRFVE